MASHFDEAKKIVDFRVIKMREPLFLSQMEFVAVSQLSFIHDLGPKGM